MSIDTGDTVFHRPTRETWLVAHVDGDRLYWCGWPEGTAAVCDCLLVDKAMPATRYGLLVEMAAGREGTRARMAQEKLRQIPVAAA